MRESRKSEVRNMRRKDRETDRETAFGITDRCAFVTLALFADGEIYAVPLSVARIGDDFYFHCAKTGRKTQMLRKNPKVCMSCVGNVAPDGNQFAVTYESATVFGTAEEVNDESEKRIALQAIASRYTPQAVGFEEECARERNNVAVWKIRISEITGKRRAKRPNDTI